MKSYVYETVKLSDGRRIVSKYTLGESIIHDIIKLLFYIFIVWPFQLFVWWPIKIMFKGALIVCELVLRGIWWLVKLPFTLLFMKRIPRF